MWALIVNEVVAEVTDIDPAGRYHSSYVWVECPEDVVAGWSFDGKLFSAPLPNKAEAILVEKIWRDGELQFCSSVVSQYRDEFDLDPTVTTISNDQFIELLKYRQALRAWPDSSSDKIPDVSKRPTCPEWVHAVK